MKFRVLVRLKPGILDVQGTAVKRALGGLGFDEVSEVRIGKMVEVEVEAPSVERGRERIAAMCGRLLTNPILEDYAIEEVPEVAARGAGR
jgi:phosphoribosylformylglycinamidine synthase